MLVKLQENPLRPFEVVRVGGVDLTRPVERETDALELLAEVVDVLLGHARGMDMVLNRVVFRRQTESVPADREKHIVAFHAAFAGDDVHCGVAARMTDMQTRSGGVRELNQSIEFGLFVAGFRLEAMGILPALLPFEFDLIRIISLAHG